MFPSQALDPSVQAHLGLETFEVCTKLFRGSVVLKGFAPGKI